MYCLFLACHLIALVLPIWNPRAFACAQDTMYYWYETGAILLYLGALVFLYIGATKDAKARRLKAR